MPRIEAKVVRNQTIGNDPGEIGVFELSAREELQVSIGALNNLTLLIMLAAMEDDAYLSLSPRLSFAPEPRLGRTPMPISDARLEIDIDGALPGRENMLGLSRWWGSGELVAGNAGGPGLYVAHLSPGYDGLHLSNLPTSQTTIEAKADEAVAVGRFSEELSAHLDKFSLPHPDLEIRCHPQALARPVLTIMNRGEAAVPIDVRS